LEQFLGSGAPLKMKLSGRGRLAASRNESEARRRQQLGRPSAGELDDCYLFTGGQGRGGGGAGWCVGKSGTLEEGGATLGEALLQQHRVRASLLVGVYNGNVVWEKLQCF
jgi:hypothetical protein